MSTSTLPVAPTTCYSEKKGTNIPLVYWDVLIIYTISHVESNILGSFYGSPEVQNTTTLDETHPRKHDNVSQFADDVGNKKNSMFC